MAGLAVAVAAAVVVLGGLAGCSDDDGGSDETATTEAPAGTPGHGRTSSTTLATGDLDIAVPDRFTPIPLPSAGFGLAIPLGWEATVLTEEALGRLAELEGASPGFVAAARNAASSGATLYAAGVDDQGRVADLKLMRIPQTTAPDAAAVESAAEQARAQVPGGAELELVADAQHPTARLRFEVSGGEVTAVGTQYLIAGPDSIYSLIVTSEDPANHDQLASTIAESLTFA